MPNDSRSGAQYSLRFFIYLGMLLLVPMGGMAENSESIAPACSTVAIEAGTETECSVDLSAYPGVSSIRYQYVSSSDNIQTMSSVMDTGAAHTCGILDNGSAMCWGSNGYGQLGDGTYTSEFAEVNSNQFNLISGNGINQNGDGLFERFQYDGLMYHIIA